MRGSRDPWVCTLPLATMSSLPGPQEACFAGEDQNITETDAFYKSETFDPTEKYTESTRGEDLL